MSVGQSSSHSYLKKPAFLLPHLYLHPFLQPLDSLSHSITLSDHNQLCFLSLSLLLQDFQISWNVHLVLGHDRKGGRIGILCAEELLKMVILSGLGVDCCWISSSPCLFLHILSFIPYLHHPPSPFMLLWCLQNWTCISELVYLWLENPHLGYSCAILREYLLCVAFNGQAPLCCHYQLEWL
jgi:hypothetical protein